MIVIYFRYTFVKQLRGKIDSQLGQLIDEELEKLSIHPHEVR